VIKNLKSIASEGVDHQFPDNLSLKRMQKRDEYLASNPAIKHIYHVKQRLLRLLTKRHCTAKQCQRLRPIFTGMVKQLKQTEFKHLST
jgi:transposase